MNTMLAGKDNVGWMSGRELGMRDAVSLGRIYTLNKAFVPEEVKGITHFYWVGASMFYSDKDRLAKLQPKHGYGWGPQTAWHTILCDGYDYDYKEFRRIYGFFEPANSPNLAGDSLIACGGWTQVGGRRERKWGLDRGSVSGEAKYGQLRTWFHDRDWAGDFYVATERLQQLQSEEMPRHPRIPTWWWRVFGGCMDVRNNTSDIRTRVFSREWGRSDPEHLVEIASFRTDRDAGKRDRKGYGRCYLTLAR